MDNQLLRLDVDNLLSKSKETMAAAKYEQPKCQTSSLRQLLGYNHSVKAKSQAILTITSSPLKSALPIIKNFASEVFVLLPNTCHSTA